MRELESVLFRPRFDRYLDRELRQEFVDLIGRNVDIYSVPNQESGVSQPPCRDPNDQMFLELALIAGVQILISSDKDLLVLNPWQGITIMTPAEFVVHA
jgi:uncharacterized protein